MGLFKMFQKKEIKLGAPIAGECVPISEVSDPVFGEEIMGKGIAIKPSSGRIVAPIAGVVSTIFPTNHAVAITTEEGTEILIHFGLDTVALEGKFFTAYVVTDQKVEKGDLLVEVDVEKIKEAGYDVITPMVICNSADYTEIIGITGKHVNEGEIVLTIQK